MNGYRLLPVLMLLAGWSGLAAADHGKSKIELSVRGFARNPPVAVASCDSGLTRGSAVNPGTVSGANATFQFPAAAGRKGCHLWAGAPPLAFAVAEPMFDGRPALHLGEGGQITLRLRTTRGELPVDPSLSIDLQWKADTEAADWLAVPREVIATSQDEAAQTIGFTGLATGIYRVTIESEELATAPLPFIDLAPGQRVGPIDVTLKPRSRICGFVVIPADAPPVETSFIRWWRVGAEGDGAVELGASGDFCIEGLERGARIGLTALRGAVESRPIYTSAPAEGIAVESVVGPILRGVVHVEGESGPPAEVELAIYLPEMFDSMVDAPPMKRMTLRAADGRFAVELPGAGEDLVLVFRAGGYAPETIPISGAEVPEELRVELTKGAALEGTVVASATGEGVRDARIDVTCRREDQILMRRQSSSGGDGTFHLDALPRKALCEIEAVADGMSPGSTRISISDGDSLVDAELILDPEAWIDGRVVLGESSEPISGARLHLLDDGGSRAGETSSGDDGRFRFGGLAAKAYSLRVEHDRGAISMVVRAGRGGPDVVLRLDPVIDLRGRVLNGSDGLVGARISIISGDGSRLDAEAGMDGFFRAENVATGRVSFVISHRSLASGCTAERWLDIEQTEDLVLQCEGDITVRVRGLSATPGTLLYLVNEGTDRIFTTSARTDAVAVFSNVAAGRYRLEIVQADGERRVLWWGVISHETSDIELVVPAPRS